MAESASWARRLSAVMALLPLLPRPALPGGATLTLVGHNSAALPGMVQVVGDVGAGPFDPAKLKHWVADQRQPLFAATPGPHCNCAEPSCPTGGPCSAMNIYSPQAVQLSGQHIWRLYFHGWDGVERNNRFDRIYMSETTDGFGTFGPHRLMVDHGVFANVGNENVLRVSPTDWRMAYTTLNGTPPLLNKPGYAHSTDGLSWSPSAGTHSSMVEVAGFSNYSAGDFNGVNVLFHDPATKLFHFYFDDSRYNRGAEHAVGTDGQHFKWEGHATRAPMALQDVKAFVVNGSTMYWSVYWWNTPQLTIYTSTSANLSDLGTPTAAFVRLRHILTTPSTALPAGACL